MLTGAQRGAVPGEVLSERYVIERVVGQGAYGRVFLARDLVTQAPVALKEFVRSQGRSDSFVREVGILFELDHPAVIRCHSLLVLGPYRYIVVEYLDGGSLRDLLDRPASDPKLLLSLLLQAASGVAYAHAQGVIHRDLKPENILLQRTAQGLRARVSDFGISVLGTSRSSNPLGSPAYMAPEQFQEQHDARVDVYALGIMLYEILCERRPFEGSPAFLMACHLQTEIELPEWLPPALAQIIRKATAKRPERRYPTVDAFAIALESALDPSTDEILSERITSVSPSPRALALGTHELLVVQGDECLRLSLQGRLIRRVPGAQQALASGRFHAIATRDRTCLEGPSLRRTLRGISPPFALSHEGAFAFLIDGRPVCIDRLGNRRLLDPPGPVSALAFVGPEQRLALVLEMHGTSLLTIDDRSVPLPCPVVDLCGHPERDELVARSALDPDRVVLIRGDRAWQRRLPSGPLSCDGEHFFAATPDGQLASLSLAHDRVAITRWASPLGAVCAGSGRLAWVDRLGNLGVE